MSARPRAAAVLAGAGVICLLTACIEPPAPPPPARAFADVCAVIEQNAARLDRPICAPRITAKARFKDDRGRRQSENLEGTLVFSRPRNLRVDLKPGLGEKVVEIGSNDNDYWVWIEPNFAAMYWGSHRNAGKPCVGKMPVRPDQILAALGLCGLPHDAELLGPVFRQEEHADVLAYIRREESGAYRYDREYHVSRRPPFLFDTIQLYDAEGRRAVSALLDDYRPAWKDGPLVPHRIDIRWPGEDAEFRVEARSFEAANRTSPRAFERPGRAYRLPASIREIIQVDRDCETSPGDSVRPPEPPTSSAPERTRPVTESAPR